MGTRTCLVTGAGRGIGRAVAQRLAADGHRVALTARNADQLAEVAGTLAGESMIVPADITEPDQIDELFGTVEQRWGPVEVLVANAGAGSSAPLARTTDEEWLRMLELNLTAPFRCIRRAVPPMVQGRWGRIVVVASVAARRGEPYISAYSASKHGVLGLVRAAASELARTGVTVNAVCPSYVDTPMTAATVATISEKTGRSEAEAMDFLVGQQPIGRLIVPDEVAQAVSFCLLNAAVTGQAINVDGGAVQS